MYQQSQSTLHSYQSDSSKVFPPGYKRPKSIVGYTGHYSIVPEESHILDSPNSKIMIRGYCGFRPDMQNVVGEPLIPSEEKQQATLGMTSSIANNSFAYGDDYDNDDNNSNNNKSFDFNSFAKNLDIMERYNTAVQHILSRGQSQDRLLKIVQAKISERVSSYAQQHIRTRKLFEGFDNNKDGVLDEGEFRSCLEKLNVQFDDVQCLALFAYFDDDNDGFIQWDQFSENATIYNPRGSCAILPKIITDQEKVDRTSFNDFNKKKIVFLRK